MRLVEQDRSPSQLLGLVGRRYEFLVVLDTHTHDKRTLEEKLGVSRSTVDRALRELETATLVQQTPEGYRTTLYGYTLITIYDLLLDYVDHVQRSRALLAELPPEIEFDIGLLIDAEVVVAEEPAFHAPAARIARLVEATSEVRGLAYAHTSPEAMELFERKVFEEEMPTEIVFRRKMYRNIEATAPEIVESLATAEHYTAYVSSDVPFGLFLLSIDGTEHVCLIVYDDEQNLKGIIVNDTADAVAWGNRLLESYRTRATPVSSGAESRTKEED